MLDFLWLCAKINQPPAVVEEMFWKRRLGFLFVSLPTWTIKVEHNLVGMVYYIVVLVVGVGVWGERGGCGCLTKDYYISQVVTILWDEVICPSKRYALMKWWLFMINLAFVHLAFTRITKSSRSRGIPSRKWKRKPKIYLGLFTLFENELCMKMKVKVKMAPMQVSTGKCFGLTWSKIR